MNLRKYAFFACVLATPISSFGGAWGVGSFENDSALDWSYELETTSTMTPLENAFNSVKEGSYIETDACSTALAAAEIVASIKQSSFGNLPVSIELWAKTNSTGINEDLVLSASLAITSCADEKKSELAQLWRESESDEWSSYVSDLKARLK